MFIYDEGFNTVSLPTKSLGKILIFGKSGIALEKKKKEIKVKDNFRYAVHIYAFFYSMSTTFNFHSFS